MTVKYGEAVIRAAYERYARGEIDQLFELVHPSSRPQRHNTNS
jgi:hypothetical protein